MSLIPFATCNRCGRPSLRREPCPCVPMDILDDDGSVRVWATDYATAVENWAEGLFGRHGLTEVAKRGPQRLTLRVGEQVESFEVTVRVQYDVDLERLPEAPADTPEHAWSSAAPMGLVFVQTPSRQRCLTPLLTASRTRASLCGQPIESTAFTDDAPDGVCPGCRAALDGTKAGHG